MHHTSDFRIYLNGTNSIHFNYMTLLFVLAVRQQGTCDKYLRVGLLQQRWQQETMSVCSLQSLVWVCFKPCVCSPRSSRNSNSTWNMGAMLAHESCAFRFWWSALPTQNRRVRERRHAKKPCPHYFSKRTRTVVARSGAASSFSICPFYRVTPHPHPTVNQNAKFNKSLLVVFWSFFA